MENIFEILVPLIFAAIYFFGNMMSKKEEDVSPPGKRRQPTEEEEAIQARQREIQEAIRRKILERRGGPNAPSGEPQPTRTMSPPHRPRPEVMPKPAARVAREPEPMVSTPVAGSFSWDATGNAYQQQMEERERQIEKTRKQAEAIRKKAGGLAVPSQKSRRSPSRSRRSFSGSVRSRLNNPGDARVAILYAEVLGPPLALSGRTRIPSDR
jgi:hypothetical protein